MQTIFAVLVLGLASLTAVAQDQQSTNPQPPRTLREQALIEGHATRVIYGCGVALKLMAIVADATLIVVGEAKEVATHLGADDDSVWTDYEFTIAGTIKGDSTSGDRIIVAKAGGKVEIGGAVAELRIETSRPLVSGARYLLFLLPSRFGEARTYWIADGDKGTYLITAGDAIECRDNGAVLDAPCGQPLEAFVSAVRKTLIEVDESASASR